MKIEKGISKSDKRVGRPSKYPFSQMEVGDSVLFSGNALVGRRAYVAAKNLQWRREKEYQANLVGKSFQPKECGDRPKFTCRVSDEGTRIWRTE